jgi:hypothetical protein
MELAPLQVLHSRCVGKAVFVWFMNYRFLRESVRPGIAMMKQSKVNVSLS